MKENIHPTYYANTVVTCACGHTWTTGSTVPEIRTDICSECHPFYTGEQRIVDTAGQVERFMNRLKHYGVYSEAKEDRLTQAQQKAEQTFLNQQIIALDLSDRIFEILTNANYVTIGDILNKIEKDEDALLALEGFGPKALEQIKEKIDNVRQAFQLVRGN